MVNATRPPPCVASQCHDTYSSYSFGLLGHSTLCARCVQTSARVEWLRWLVAGSSLSEPPSDEIHASSSTPPRSLAVSPAELPPDRRLSSSSSSSSNRRATTSPAGMPTNVAASSSQ
mmetsp:Transcript_18606/g.55064  ORF Transcript_18606/g.55064 Transcript_18606/m.55064 type:complete len:117 (-) Transcript_18606:85-435(-)